MNVNENSYSIRDVFVPGFIYMLNTYVFVVISTCRCRFYKKNMSR